MANALFSNLYGQGYDTGILPGAQWGGTSTADIYGLYDKRRRDQEAMDLLPGDAEGFNPLLPRLTAQSQGISPEQYQAATQGNGVGVFGKVLGLLGLDAEGHRAAQPWGNALMQTLGTAIDPVGTGAHFVQGLDQSFQDLDHALQHPSVSPEWGREVGAPAFDITSAVAMGGGAVPKQAGTAGTFGGRLAKTADHAKLAQAEEMAGRGVPREQIWNDTGWFKGVDGKWRFEIDDSGARATPQKSLGFAQNNADVILGRPDIAATMLEKGWGGRLSRGLDHGGLYNAYPSMADTYLAFLNKDAPRLYGGAYRGIFDQSGIGINKDLTIPETRSTLLHEGQHWVQKEEGFAQGTNKDAAPKDANGGTVSPYEWYRKNAGETEARTVQKRMDLTPDERASRPPWLDYDVPEDQQIVRFGGGNNALFSNDSRASIPGTVVQFPSRGIPEGYRTPSELDLYQRYSDALSREAMQRGTTGSGDTSALREAAQPLLKDLANRGLNVMQPFDYYGHGQPMMALHRAAASEVPSPLRRGADITFEAKAELPAAEHKGWPYTTDDAWNNAMHDALEYDSMAVVDRLDRGRRDWKNWEFESVPNANSSKVRQKFGGYDDSTPLERGGTDVRVSSSATADDMADWMRRAKSTGTLYSNSKEASIPGVSVSAGNAKAAGEPRANHSVFDVAEQVARLIGSDPSAVRHHPTSFGNSSYLGGYRISDHPVGAGRYATEGGGFDSALGADAIAEQINNSRRNQMAEMLNAPPPERQPWMNGRDWSEERQRFANRRPGWLTKEQWDTLRQRHAAGEPLDNILAANRENAALPGTIVQSAKDQQGITADEVDELLRRYGITGAR